MTRGVPVLDPRVHFVDATPEALARALFRRIEPINPELRNRRRGKEAMTEKPPPEKASNVNPSM
ncbi:MAG: hypothetical protein OXE76_08160 [Alphaproteobacteria bacterium]|nr:hypothetical protein [Alphaproteobacteria bacterium]